jgi:hypothetical protein
MHAYLNMQMTSNDFVACTVTTASSITSSILSIINIFTGEVRSLANQAEQHQFSILHTLSPYAHGDVCTASTSLFPHIDTDSMNVNLVQVKAYVFSGKATLHLYLVHTTKEKVTFEHLLLNLEPSESFSIQSKLSLPLPMASKEDVSLKAHSNLVLLSIPSMQTYQIYSTTPTLHLLDQLAVQYIPKDAKLITAGFHYTDHLLACLAFLLPNRHQSSLRMVYWSRAPNNHPVVMKTNSLPLQAIIIQPCPMNIGYSNGVSCVQDRLPRLVLGLDAAGKVWSLQHHVVKSAFAGAMYPVGYRLIQAIEQYKEAEDELDRLPVIAQQPGGEQGVLEEKQQEEQEEQGQGQDQERLTIEELSCAEMIISTTMWTHKRRYGRSLLGWTLCSRAQQY